MRLELFMIISVCAIVKCHIQKRVALGQEVKPHSMPYRVHIIFLLKEGQGVPICGGALISQNYVLTAAHCIDNENITQAIVVMGAHNLTETNKVTDFPHTFKPHEEYKKNLRGHAVNDIMLIKLSKPVTFTEHIQSIKLPRRSQNQTSFNEVNAMVAGWGATEDGDSSMVLIQAESLTDETVDDKCKLPSSLICSIQTDGSPCTGDSGSALVYNNTVIGVLSSGFCVMFSYYTRVTSFLDWIEYHSDVKVED